MIFVRERKDHKLLTSTYCPGRQRIALKKAQRFFDLGPANDGPRQSASTSDSIRNEGIRVVVRRAENERGEARRARQLASSV